MNHPVDMHPEDLLDREQYGQLSLDEQRRLDTHCTRCSSCDILRRVTRDFTIERQVNTADPVMLDRLVEGAMESVSPVTARYAPVAFMPRRQRKPWAVAAVIMFAATGAAASFSSTVRQVVMERSLAPVMHAFYEPRPLTNISAVPAPKKAAIAAPKVFEPVPERIVPAPPPVSLNTHPTPREPIAVAAPKMKAPEVVTTTVTAEQLMRAITEARQRHDNTQAIQFYRRLQRQFPGSPEEATSTYTIGRLLYDSGEDVPGALDLFNRYLAESSNGTLAEEARLGRALALQRLGRTSEERQAWLDLLSAHPRSVHAERARRRLDQLR